LFKTVLSKVLNSITIVILFGDVKMQTVPTKLTERLVIESEELIKEGWYANKSELIRDAIRDLIIKLKMQKLEKAIKEDVEWGLYGE
tara:strand:+ start:7278 stop:7538 length:261 start_codon:yes stop_codon:yes gene_type:complete